MLVHLYLLAAPPGKQGLHADFRHRQKEQFGTAKKKNSAPPKHTQNSAPPKSCSFRLPFVMIFVMWPRKYAFFGIAKFRHCTIFGFAALPYFFECIAVLVTLPQGVQTMMMASLMFVCTGGALVTFMPVVCPASARCLHGA